MSLFNGGAFQPNSEIVRSLAFGFETEQKIVVIARPGRGKA